MRLTLMVLETEQRMASCFIFVHFVFPSRHHSRFTNKQTKGVKLSLYSLPMYLSSGFWSCCEA